MVQLLTLGTLGFLIAFLLTPIVRDFFLRIGLVDLPDNDRKRHARSIPRVGGIAIFVSYSIAYILLALLPTTRSFFLHDAFTGRWGLFAAFAVVFATGLLDDLLTLEPKQKLLGQLIAATLVWSSGLKIELFQDAAFGAWLSYPVTVFWLIACANAFNLIDGLDGLAAGAGLVGTVTMIAAAILDHNLALAMISVPLAGCLLAFLCFNFNPASVFLGDCGSLTIGFLLGCLAMMWAHTSASLNGYVAAVAAVALPLFDTSIAIARRFLRSRPIFSPDRGHVHHRLLDRGNSVRQTAFLLYGCSAVAAVFALILRYAADGESRTGAVIAFAVAVAAAVRYLRYVEFATFGKIFQNGVIFRMIDDEVKLHQLEEGLAECREDARAIELIRKTCSDLGVRQTFLIGREGGVIDSVLDLSESQIQIAAGTDRVVVLHGLDKNRQMPTNRLIAVIEGYFAGQTRAIEREEEMYALEGLQRARASRAA